MKNVAVYPRVSSEDQQERGTIEAQIEFGTKYADLHQLNIIDWYKDDGVSGTIPIEERPESSRMLEDAKAKKFDTVLVYKLDRLGRSARVILNAVHAFEELGIKVKSMTEPFDTGDPAGRFLLTILAGVADLERSNILDRLWHGANRAARQGKWLGGIVPYGYYVNDEGFLTVNENPIPGMEMSEADVVLLIYRLTVEQRMSTIRIADYLNAIGVPTAYVIAKRMLKRGKRKVNTAGIWRPSRVRNIIVNPTYKGIHEYGKRTNKQRETIKREVPALVKADYWDEALQVLKDNQLEAMRSAKRLYLLRGLVKCGTCGLNYHGTGMSGAGKKMTAYYVCNGKTSYRGPLLGKCDSKNIPADWLEEYVWNDCLFFINSPEEVLASIDESLQQTASTTEIRADETKIIRNALDNKEAEKESILDLFRKKLINSMDVEKQLEKINTERTELEQRIKNLETQATIQDNTIADYKKAKELLTGLKQTLTDNPSLETKREIIKILVKEITVNTIKDDDTRPQAAVTIKYSFTKDVLRTDRDSSQR